MMYERIYLNFAYKNVGNKLGLVIAFEGISQDEVFGHDAIECDLVSLCQRSSPFLIRQLPFLFGSYLYLLPSSTAIEESPREQQLTHLPTPHADMVNTNKIRVDLTIKRRAQSTRVFISHEFIANPWLRENMRWMLRIRLDLVAQLINEDSQVV